MKSAEYLVDRAAACVIHLPAREFLGHRIDVFDMAFGVGRDNAVADRSQRDLGALRFAEKRLLVKLGIGNVDLDAEQAQQTSFLVQLGFRPAHHPAPFAVLVPHAVHTLEELRLAVQVLAHFCLHARHIVGMHQSVPVRRHIFVVLVITKHRFPAPG